MIIIQVKSTTLEEMQGTAKLSGKPYHMRKQDAWIFNTGENEYPERFTMNLAKDQVAYPVGYYELLPSSFTIGDFNTLAIGQVALKPLPAATIAAIFKPAASPVAVPAPARAA